MTEMNAAPMNDEEEKQPFYKTPLGIILIIVCLLYTSPSPRDS